MKWYYTIVYYIINLSSITSHVVLYGYMLVLFQQLMGLNMRINVLLLVHGLCSAAMTDRPLNTLTYYTIVRVSPYPSGGSTSIGFQQMSRVADELHVLCREYVYNMYNFCCCSLLPPVASAPTNLMAVQEGLTGIRVSWTPPTPLGDTTGYRIYYSGGSSGSMDVSGGSTDNHLLSGLQNGASYTISIVGTSEHFFSDRVGYPSSIPLSEFLQLASVFQRGAS